MIVYHGGFQEVKEIDLSKCRTNTDFGQGFYVTKFKEQAEYWAKQVGLYHKTTGVISEFEFYEGTFTERLCDVKHFAGYTEEWLDFVVKNRDPQFTTLQHNYDIVEGPVADDKIKIRLTDYLNRKITKLDFLNELTYSNPSHQICFCTVKSLLTIKKNNTDQTLLIGHIGDLIIESFTNDYKLKEDVATDKFFTSTTFAQLADEKTKLYTKPWQEIYAMLKEELAQKQER
ncbi:hypothetical protein FACS1894201_11330 [Bacteroidia bacterium]|nr:hypothetical protein FACS1894201_11330 [Bacteroidia bacterium]